MPKLALACLATCTLASLLSCEQKDGGESHFIYFSPTEPYTRIDGVECSINNFSKRITNIRALPSGTDLTAMKVWFVTNSENDGVFVNGVEQQSGVTVNDFSSPVEYEIRTRDETLKYTVGFTVSQTSSTVAGVKLEGYTDLVASVDSDDSWWLSSGVKVSEVDLTTTAGRELKLCMFEVDLTDPSVHVRTVVPVPGQGDDWGEQTMVEMAEAVESSGEHVLGAINADYFELDDKNGDGETGEPESVVLQDGVYLKETFDNPVEGGFFAIRNDGRAAIGGYDDYLSIRDKLYNAVGGRHRLVVNGGVDPNMGNDVSIARRVAIGMNALDLKTLYMVAVEGDEGVTLAELANCMVRLGAGHALNLDGGGSTTFVVRGDDDTFEAINRPGGTLRRVGNGLVILAK